MARRAGLTEIERDHGRYTTVQSGCYRRRIAAACHCAQHHDTPRIDVGPFEQQIDAGFLLRRGNGGCNIAVADQTNARAGLAHFLNERLMARPRKYDHREILDLTSLGFSERVEVFRWAFVQIDHPFTVGTRGNLSHVSIRAVE